MPGSARTLPVRATPWPLITILPKHWPPASAESADLPGSDAVDAGPIKIPCPDAEPSCSATLRCRTSDGTGQGVTDDDANALAVRDDSHPLVQHCTGGTSEHA
jgi:hypothetical protein